MNSFKTDAPKAYFFDEGRQHWTQINLYAKGKKSNKRNNRTISDILSKDCHPVFQAED